MSRAASDLDAEIDALYESAPDTFTKKRDELAKRVKSEGNADAAATVKALRKPSQIAYVLNQVARRFTDEVGELVDVGRELARAQRKALRGGDASGDLRTAIGRQRDVVRDLTTKTAGLMRELGVAATGHLDEVAGALQAALVDPVVGAALEAGRLEKVPEPAAGFPGAAPQLEVVPPPRKSEPRPKAKETPKVDKKAAAAEKKRLAAEKKRIAREEKREAAARARAEKARTREEKERAKREAAAAKREAERAKNDAKHRQALEHAKAATEKAKELRAEATRLVAEAKELAKEARERAKEAKTAQKAATTAEHEASRLVTKARAR